MSVQLPMAGLGFGEDKGLRAARRRSQWLRERLVRAGENGDEEESRGCLVGLWGLDSTGNKRPLCGFWFWEPKIPMAGWRPQMKEML